MVKKDITLTLYYSDKCIHCIHFKPEWEKIKNNINKMNKSNIHYEEYDEYTMKNKNIQGFPSIMFNIKYNNKNHEIEYKGERNSDKLTNIIKQIDDI